MRSFNENENWGGLVSPESHLAAVGARMADNRRRDFGVFPDRVTVVGDDKAADRLYKWLFSPSTLKKIARNTSFSFYGGDWDTNVWASSHKVGALSVELVVRCSGEYCYVQAYADKEEECAE